MASCVSKLVACLVGIVAVLQLVHLMLLNQLENTRLRELRHLRQSGMHTFPDLYRSSAQSPSDSSNRHDSANYKRRASFTNFKESADVEPMETEQDLLNQILDEERAVVDSSGEFRIVFEIAGPHPGSIISSPTLSEEVNGHFIGPEGSLSLALYHTSKTDDFSIDDNNEHYDERSNSDVTLVTHGTLHEAKKYLTRLTSHWSGPISLALFAPNSSLVEQTVNFIHKVRSCDKAIRHFVSFHLVFPLIETHSRQGPDGQNRLTKVLRRKKRLNGSNKHRGKGKGKRGFDDYSNDGKFNDYSGANGNVKRMSENKDAYDNFKLCEEFSSSNNYYYFQESGSTNEPQLHKIPINLLRNVGRKKSMTEFTFVTDIGMVSCAGLRNKFQQFIRRDHNIQNKFRSRGKSESMNVDNDISKTVYVVPAFETKSHDFVANKKELLELIDNYQARPYAFDLCWKCQALTDYENWQRVKSSKGDQVNVLFEVLWKDPWEPFFISHNSVPYFDERFYQTGSSSHSKLSQLCELHTAGYKFSILNDAFLIHPGYKTFPNSVGSYQTGGGMGQAAGSHGLLSPPAKIYKQFKMELRQKYPHSTRRCY